MNDCIPFYRPGKDLTATADGAITGKRFVFLSKTRESGPGLAAKADGSNYVVKMGAPAAGGAALGVSKYDAADKGKVGVILYGSIVPVTAVAALTFGTFVGPDATGKAVAGGKAGYVMADCAAGADAQILLLPPAP